MSNNNLFKKSAIFIALSAILSGCGGGGGADENAAPDRPNSDTFVSGENSQILYAPAFNFEEFTRNGNFEGVWQGDCYSSIATGPQSLFEVSFTEKIIAQNGALTIELQQYAGTDCIPGTEPVPLEINDYLYEVNSDSQFSTVDGELREIQRIRLFRNTAEQSFATSYFIAFSPDGLRMINYDFSNIYIGYSRSTE